MMCKFIAQRCDLNQIYIDKRMTDSYTLPSFWYQNILYNRAKHSRKTVWEWILREGPQAEPSLVIKIFRGPSKKNSFKSDRTFCSGAGSAIC